VGRLCADTDAGPAQLRLHEFYVQDKKRRPSAPPSAFVFSGNGLNMVYVDPQNDLVAVVRWIDGSTADGFVKRLLAAVKQS
jgi:hypothetical protein